MQGDTPIPSDSYTVVTNSGDALRLRKEPNTISAQVGYIPNGTTFHSDTVVEGENVGGCKAWVFYQNGYASGKFLTPVPVVPEPPSPVPETVDITLPVLKKGDTGGEVLTVQMLLNEIGVKGKDGKKLKEDRIFGENVEYAVGQYQKIRNLPVTYICDYEFWNRILK